MSENTHTTEAQTANQPEFDLQRPDHIYEHERGREYLGLFADVDIDGIAEDAQVLAEDVRRIIYTTGATLIHGVGDEHDVRYEGDGYAVTADEGHLDVVQEQISREITDEHALEAEHEMADEYDDVDADEIDDEDAIAHYREYLRYAVIDAMAEMDAADTTYPVGYPLVVLTDGDRA